MSRAGVRSENDNIKEDNHGNWFFVASFFYDSDKTHVNKIDLNGHKLSKYETRKAQCF